jgi:hypothetical protein
MNASQKTYENSVLQLGVLRKIEQIAETTAKETVTIKDQIILQNMTVSGMSSLIKKQNKILEDIREAVLSSKNDSDANKKAKSDVLSGTPIAKLAAAAGLVAVMALGLWTMGMVFDSLKNLPPKAIYNAIGVALAMIPITKAFTMIIEAMPSTLLGSPKLMLNIIGSLIVMALGFAAFGFAMKLTPILTGEQLIGSLAVAGVVLMMGYVYAALLERLTSTGFANYLMNKNKTNKAMQSMLTIAIALVGIGLALRMAPRVTIKEAAAFVILSAVMLPMALTFVALKFAFFLSRKITVKDVTRTTAMMSIIAAALIPIGYAAALIPSLSPNTAKNLKNLSPILLPLAAVATLIVALQQKKASKGLMKGMIPAGAEPKEDKKKFDPKVIMYVALGMVAVVAAMVGVAYIVSKSGPVLNSATQVMANLNYKGLFGMLGLISAGAIMVALVVNIMRGRGSSKTSTGLKSVFGGSMESSQGTIKTNDMIVAAAIIPVVALGIVMAAWIFKGLPGTFVSPDPEFTLKAGLAIFIFGVAMAKISNMTQKLKSDDLAKGTIVVLAVTMLIAAVATLFSVYPGDPGTMPSFKFIAIAASAILIFAAPLALITYLTRNIEYKTLFKGALASAIIAMSIVGVAYIFSYLNSVTGYVAPPYEWSLKAGLAILVFGGAYALVSILTSKLGIKTMLQGIIGVAVIALAILAVGWIFNMLNGVGFVAPPISWSVAVALSLVAFTIPALVIGLIATSGIGAVGLLLGVVGMIVIAAGIWVVAWIFSRLPDLTSVSKMLTEALLTPVNGIVDVLKRLKEEIGVENLLPLAGGIIAIAGSLLILAAASAGAAAAGLGASLMNAGKAFVDWLSGGDTKGPLDILQEIINMGPKIMELAKPIESIGRAISFLMGGPDMEQMTKFIEAVGTSSVTASQYGKSLEGIFMTMASSSAAIAMMGKNGASTISAFAVLDGVSRSTIDSASDFIKRLGKTSLDSQASAMQKIAKSYGTISKSSNSINIEAINATTDMFKALAYLYQNGRRNAIEELGDKLIDAVEELARMIADFDGTVNAQSEGNKEVGSSISNALDGLKNLIPGGSLLSSSSDSGGEASSGDALFAIQELVDLLQSGQAKITITDLDPAAEAKLA